MRNRSPSSSSDCLFQLGDTWRSHKKPVISWKPCMQTWNNNIQMFTTQSLNYFCTFSQMKTKNIWAIKSIRSFCYTYSIIRIQKHLIDGAVDAILMLFVKWMLTSKDLFTVQYSEYCTENLLVTDSLLCTMFNFEDKRSHISLEAVRSNLCDWAASLHTWKLLKKKLKLFLFSNWNH